MLIGTFEKNAADAHAAISGITVSDVTRRSTGSAPARTVLRTFTPLHVAGSPGGTLTLSQDYAPVAAAAHRAYLPVVAVLELVPSRSLHLALPHPAPCHATPSSPDGRDRAPGALRRAHRPPQPDTLPRIGRRGARLPRRATRRPAHRPRPLQGDQRHLGHTNGDELSACWERGLHRRSWTARRSRDSAATSSASSRDAQPTPSRRSRSPSASATRSDSLSKWPASRSRCSRASASPLRRARQRHRDSPSLCGRRDVRGKGRHVPQLYTTDHDTGSPARLALMSELRAALVHDGSSSTTNPRSISAAGVSPCRGSDPLAAPDPRLPLTGRVPADRGAGRSLRQVTHTVFGRRWRRRGRGATRAST